MALDFEVVKQQLESEYARLALTLTEIPAFAISDQGRSIDTSGQRSSILEQMEKLRKQIVAMEGPSFISSRFRT